MSAETDSPHSGPNRLRDLLRRRAAEVAVEAAKDGGPVPPERLEELERIARLVERFGKEARAGRRFWPIAAVVIGTLVLVGIFLFTRVSETDIELDLATDEVGFSSPTPQELADLPELATLRVAGLEEIRVPPHQSQPERTFEEPAGTPWALELSEAPDIGTGSIRLVSVALPTGEAVRLEAGEPGPRVHLYLHHAPQELRVFVFGTVRVRITGEGAEPVELARTLEFANPGFFVLRSGAEPFDLELGLAEGASRMLAQHLLVEDLKLSRVDQHLAKRSLAWHVSTVLSGTLRLDSLGGDPLPLGPGEPLRFAQSRGEISELAIADGYLELGFRGRVEGMALGSGAHPRSLMPTSIDRIRDRRGLPF